jgi:alpha-galactosidase
MTSSLIVPRTEVARFRGPVIDAHSHAYAKTDMAIADWAKLQEEVGVRQTFIFTGASGAEFRKLAAQYPSPRFVMFAGFLQEDVDAPDYEAKLRARLHEDVAAGARGLGELTDKGLGLVRVGKRAYFIDDARFDPLWDEAGKLHLPVFVHIAEPAAFYEKPDERNDLRRSANWSLYGKGTPGFDAMLSKFEAVVARHPDTTFIAVHAFNLANDLGRVDALLRKHPNVKVDFSARMWELARQPYSARRFFIQHADRILFGTDNDPTRAMYLAHVRQLETQDEWFWPADAEWWRGYGMNLPAEVLQAVYHDNAARLWDPGVGIHLDFDDQMRSRVVAGNQALGPFTESETLLTDKGEISGFALEQRKYEAQRLTVVGRAGSISKQIEVSADPSQPNWLFVRVSYRNEGAAPIQVLGYTSHHYTFSADPTKPAEPAFWSYQSASYESRPDWVLPLTAGFTRKNFLGMNDSDYGGGTPIVDVWRRDVGIAIGHIELAPKPVSLPVQRLPNGDASLALTAERKQTLAPGESLTTVRSFVAVHHGDHFSALKAYSAVMQRQGLKLTTSPKEAFDPIWCAWGYGRTFTPKQVFETLPIVKELGFRWAVLDDGWQIALGDWQPRRDKFPAGDADMKALVDRIHAAGLKAQLWWAPLAADPRSRTERQHPDWLLKNADQSNRKITWWNSQYLCPAVESVRADAAAFARKALVEWGFDGLKIDGQHLNAAPACFNPAHHHQSPEDAAEGVPGFFKAIWDSAQAARPGALVEICPCGTGYSFFTLPYLNMTVASDPESSWQVRLKGKTLKALAGDGVAYFGDHVEMSKGGEDYASTFGVGGVIGTNFAWPGAPGQKDPKLLLTPHRQALWKKWTQLYEQMRLPEGQYIGDLYDIGFDKPETHVVRKDGKLYYAFYATSFEGPVELRGLESKSYQVRDYVHDRDLGVVTGPIATLHARFDQSLLIEVRPR